MHQSILRDRVITATGTRRPRFGPARGAIVSEDGPRLVSTTCGGVKSAIKREGVALLRSDYASVEAAALAGVSVAVRLRICRSCSEAI